MSAITKTVARVVLGSLAGSLAFSAIAQAAPSFAPTADIGWYAYNRLFIAPKSGQGPVMQDPSRPYVNNDEFRATGRQPTERVADLNSPILQPWAREVLRKRNEAVLSGKPPMTPTASCWPKGPTAFLLSPMTQPMYFIQGAQDVVMVLTSFNDVRHIHMTDKHAVNVKPSWYGDSIGHYEGDTLVIDTVGIDKRSWVDGFATPHTEQMHVVERYRLIENGAVLEASVHVEDPGAFTMPWNAMQLFRQYEKAVRETPIERLANLASVPEGPLGEHICAENPTSFFANVESLPVPQTKTPDF